MRVTLNLLPEEKKEEIARARRFKAAIFWEAAILAVAIVCLLFLVSLNYILSFEVRSLQELENQDSGKEQYQAVKKYEEAFSDVTAKTGELALVSKDQLYWSKLFEELSSIIPDGIKVSSISTKNFALILTGSADTRDNLISFKDKLAGDKCFTDVDLPLSNLVSRDNADFQMNLKVKRECLNNANQP